MKKKVSVLVAVLLLFSFVLVGCGDKGSVSALSGTTWKLTGGKSADGIEVTSEDMGMSDFTLEFKKGGDLTATLAGETSDGKYKEDGDSTTLTIDGEDVSVTIEDNKMTMEQDDVSLIFEKQ